jgi:RNA polymerase sigma factor (sigma-70 family)
MMRNRGNRQRILDDELAPTSATSSPEVSADSVAVRNALKTVNPELAEVAVYYYFDDLRQEEIATVMGVSRRRVADLLTRMHEALRHLLVPTPATTESP